MKKPCWKIVAYSITKNEKEKPVMKNALVFVET